MSEFGTPMPSMVVGEKPPEEATENRAAIYARTSSVNQRFGYSIKEQIRQCWKRCEMLGWEVRYVFRDQEESGKDPDRPQFQKMMSKAEPDCFDVIVFWKLDRFSRSLMHAVQLEKQLRDMGVALHGVTQQIDTTSPAGRFNFRNIASAAEFERDLIKQRSQMGMKAMALERKWPNDRPPLGYRKCNDDTIEIVKSEASIVRDIFELYLEEKSMPEVARRLDDRGVTTEEGNQWSSRAVGDVLKNQLYAGQYAVADVEQKVPEYQIVDLEVFARAERIRHRFQRGRDAERPRMPTDRKSHRIDAITEQYFDYLEETSDSGGKAALESDSNSHTERA